MRLLLRGSIPLLLLISACTTHDSDTVDRNAKETEWSARWIVEPVAAIDPRPNTWFCYRKRFRLVQSPRAATVRIAVDSKYWLWINGELVVFEGGLKRGPTPADTYYDSVGIHDFLVAGDNTIAILLWYFGKDGFSHKSSGMPGLMFQAQIDDYVVNSDSTWNVIKHPAFFDTDAPYPNYRLPESNVRFDARLDIPSWTSPAFCDTMWKHPVEIGRPPISPWNRLVKRPIPLWKFSGMCEYENADELPLHASDEPIIAKLPCNMTVSPFLEIEAEPGALIRIRTDNYGRNPRSYNIRNEYITKSGLQQYETLTYMNGHEVHYTIPAGVRVRRLGYRESGYDTEFVGTFDCDDSFYTALWRKAMNTVRINMRDGIQDPDRERAQWWGDAVSVLGQIFYCCDSNAHALVKKAILNLVDWRRSDGVLFSPVPSGSWDKELPAQMLAAVGTHGFWRYYLYTGDDATIRYVYPAVRDYLELWKTGPDGLLIHRSGDWDWVDWGANQDQTMIEHAWYCMALESASKMAAVCDDTDAADTYRDTRTALIRRINETCWNGRDYRSPDYALKSDDRANGLAVVAGVADTSKWDTIGRLLEQHTFASPFMEQYVLEAFFLMGDSDGGLRRMRTRYRGMVESDFTTLWEHWYRAAGSYNHGWAGGPLTLLSQYVLGVAPLEPGFEVYQVMPQMGHLRTLHAIVPTTRGPIVVQVEREDSSFQLNLDSPSGSVALVGIPRYHDLHWQRITANGQSVWENTDGCDQLAGVKFKELTANHITFAVEPGQWEFEAFQSP